MKYWERKRQLSRAVLVPRIDVVLVLPSGMTAVDDSVIHPATSIHLKAARTVDVAVDVWDATKRSKYANIDPNDYSADCADIG